MPNRQLPPGVLRAVQQTLRSLQQAGVAQLPKAKRGLSASEASTASDDSAALVAENTANAEEISPHLPLNPSDRLPTEVQMPNRSTRERQDALHVIAQQVARCTRCQELAETRTQTVFGVGSPAARLCFIGEAPGADEDRQGEPFVGRAGQLLTKIIEACTLRREDVYILNILKCRPPGNRTPTTQESNNCREYLHQQLDIITPQFICCLGSVAAQNLLETNQSIGRLRGRLHMYRGIQVLATYHPAYLLRNPSAKRHVWEDMQILLKEMGIEPPKT